MTAYRQVPVLPVGRSIGWSSRVWSMRISATTSRRICARSISSVAIDHPIVPPVVLREADCETTQLRFRWDGLRDVEPGLAARAKAFSQRH